MEFKEAFSRAQELANEIFSHGNYSVYFEMNFFSHNEIRKSKSVTIVIFDDSSEIVEYLNIRDNWNMENDLAISRLENFIYKIGRN